MSDADRPFHPLQACEDEIRAQLEVISKRRLEPIVGFDKDMALCAAALARALVSSASERRQQAKDDLRALHEFSDDQHAEYWKAREADDFERFTNKVKGIERKGPLLGR